MKRQVDIFREDLNLVSEAGFIPWEKLKDAVVFITGATGLVGSSFLKALVHANRSRKLNLHVLALVRDEGRARKRFEDLPDGYVSFVTGSVEDLPAIEGRIDYIMHAASQTASIEFVKHAVETIETNVRGTHNLLQLAREKKVKGFVYLSSMEVYGYPEKGHTVTENEIGMLSPLEPRNSYPISKICAEAMCSAYAVEYGLPVVICRLAQTFGPGVSDKDNRIFAYFGRCVKEKQNIVLKTKGETERCYLHIYDAVSAILTVMLKGKPGQAYNAADESTYCSIAEMAERVAEAGGIRVEFDVQDEDINGFPRTLYMMLDTKAIRKLGWYPRGIV